MPGRSTSTASFWRLMVPSFFSTVTHVSYTHLDVYKRQMRRYAENATQLQLLRVKERVRACLQSLSLIHI